MSSRNNPFEMVERMFEQMSRQFDEAARTWRHERPSAAAPGFSRMGIDLRDEGDEFVVTADVPGFQKDEIDLQIRDNTLSIDATHEQQAEEQDETYLRSEREHRSLREHVRLPEPVREDDVTATLQNGVLTVHIPKIESTETSGHQIDIE